MLRNLNVMEKGEAKIQGESKRNARRFPFLFSFDK